MLIFFAFTQSMCRALTVLHDSPHMPVTSPRSMASVAVVGAGIAAHQLELGAEHVAQHQREDVGIGAAAQPRRW